MAWSDLAAWGRQLDGSACPMCADAHLKTNQHSRLIAELRQSHARLGHNQYRRGYSVVILKRHASELYQLTDAELAGYWRDVADTAAALQRVFEAVKINYAVLGNQCPHVHCHLLPMYSHESNPPVLDMVDGEVVLPEAEREQVLADLRHYLRQLANPWGQRTGP